MNLLVHYTSSSHSPTHELFRPFASAKGLPASFSCLYHSRTIAWKVSEQKCVSKPRDVAVFSFDKDYGDAKNQGVKWYALDNLHLKILMLGLLRNWGPPVAVGAMVGAIIARRTLIFILSVSAVVLFTVNKAIEAEELHLKRLFRNLSRQSLNNMLPTTLALLSGVFHHILSAIITGNRRMIDPLHQSLVVPVRSLMSSTFFTWNPRYIPNYRSKRDISQTSTLGSHITSSYTVISDINACIKTVEGMAMSQKGMASETKWTQVKDSLFSLKAEVTSLLNADEYTVPLADVSASSDSAFKISAKNPKAFASVMSKGAKLKQSEMDEMHVISVGKREIITSVDMSGQRSAHEIQGNLDGIKGVEGVPLIDSAVSANLASTLAKDQGSGFSSVVNGIPIQTVQSCDIIHLKPSEIDTCKAQSKYIDYWFEQGPIGPASLESVEEWTKKALVEDPSYCGKGSVLHGDQDSESGIAYNAASLNLGGNLFHPAKKSDKSFIENVGFEKTRIVSDISINSTDKNCSKVDAGSAKKEIPSTKPDSMNNHIKEAALINLKDKSRSDRSQNSVVDASSRKDCVVVEQILTSQESTKELPFARENADLHILTGFSKRFNDGEFQTLMTDGETAFKLGKAGLFGDVEVGEAEVMFYKAADHFAAAAALDPYSVEALGFWGNTLLVHGELKLMVSRELRHSISTPDIISPYWLKQKKAMEAYDTSSQAALQKTCQAVCEECEELLIQAGRKYRKVLSISNSEVRALYNWGLALCFRAKLIAEEGGQNAREAADRIYLAAVDKFEAMMGVSQRYAPGALLNWGLTLKDRSRLRSADSAERVSLLQQAKQLLLDALRLQPEHAQIQSAFVTCCVELKELSERNDLKTRTNMKSRFET